MFPAPMLPSDITPHLGFTLPFSFLRQMAWSPLPSSLHYPQAGVLGLSSCLPLLTTGHKNPDLPFLGWAQVAPASLTLTPKKMTAHEEASLPPSLSSPEHIFRVWSSPQAQRGCGKLQRKGRDNGEDERTVTSLYPGKAKVPGVSSRICTRRHFPHQVLVPEVPPLAPGAGWLAGLLGRPRLAVGFPLTASSLGEVEPVEEAPARGR